MRGIENDASGFFNYLCWWKLFWKLGGTVIVVQILIACTFCIVIIIVGSTLRTKCCTIGDLVLASSKNYEKKIHGF